MEKKKKWEKSPTALVDTFYSVMESFPQADLKKMFGYPCAFLNGNMFIGLHESNLALRLGAEEREKALEAKQGGIFAPMKGRVMKEYVALSQEIIADKGRLKKMIEKAIAYTSTLPAK